MRNIVILLLAVMAWGCGAGHDSRLERADALACTDPAKAIDILDSIDTSGLSEADRAWYGLLRAKAHDKSYRHIENDSLIGFAAEYFAGRGDSLEIQALYYHGLDLFGQDSIVQSLIPLSETFSLANKANDPFYAAMAARAEAAAYGKLYLFDKKLSYARRASELFRKSGHHTHASWMDLIILQTLVSRGYYDDALLMSDSVQRLTTVEDEYFDIQILKSRAKIFDRLGQPDSVLHTYSEIRKGNISLKSADWCRIAENYLRLDNKGKAGESLDSARHFMRSKADTLYTTYIESLLSGRERQYKKGYKEAIEWGEMLMKESDRLVTAPHIVLLNDYLETKREQERSNSERNKLRFQLTLAICGIMCLIVFVIALFYHNTRKKSKYKMEMYLRTIDELSGRLGDMNTIIRHETSIGKNVSDNLKIVSELLALDTEIGNIIRTLGHKTISAEKLRNIMHQLKSKEFNDRLVSAIDIVNSSWASDLREMLPGISDSQYRLAIYLYIGLSSASIMELLEKASPAALYTSKSRSKSMLKESGDIRAAKYLRDLKFFERE